MTKEEVYNKVCGWIADGKLVSRSAVASELKYWYDIWKLVSTGDMFFTGNERVIATDVAVRDEFQKLIDSHRVMSLMDVTIFHPECKTANDVEKLVNSGQILKIQTLKSVKLYIE